MSIVRGSSLLSDNLQLSRPTHKGNIILDLMSSTFYTVIGYVCLDVVFAISLHFISMHNSPQNVAGLGLAFTTVNVLLIPMGLGTNQSLNVHTAQALGAGRQKLAQSYFNMTILLHLLYFIPVAVLILAMKHPIALTINEDERAATSDASQTYLYFLLPSSLFAILYEAVKAYMIAHKIFSVFMYIQLVTACFHILWCYIFIDVLNVGGGIAGAGIAIIITEVLNCSICLMVIRFSRYKDQVFENYSFSISIKRNKRIFLSFARTSFPIIAHIYADYFVFFLLNFIAVSFGSIQLNAQLALSNTSNLYYKFPISLSLALMTYIGNEMGSKNIKQAKKYAFGGVLLFIIFTTCFLTLLSVFRYQWAAFYASSPEIQQLILDVYPIFVFGFFIIDGLQGTLTGILKGIERKELVTYSTLLVYYLIGIPLVLFYSCQWGNFGLGQKVYGIWFAFMIVNAVLALLYLWVAIITNWNKQSERICQRVEKQNKIQQLEDNLNKELFDDEEKRQSHTQLTTPQTNKVEPDIGTQQTSVSPSPSNQWEYKQIIKEQQNLGRSTKDLIKESQQIYTFGNQEKQTSISQKKKTQYSLPGEKKNKIFSEN